MRQNKSLLLLAVFLTACGGSGGGSNTSSSTPDASPVVQPPNGGNQQAPAQQPVQQAPTCGDLALIGQWTKIADAQGNLDTSDVLTFNNDCTGHDLSCTVDFVFTPPNTQPDWSQYSATQGAFTIHDSTPRLNVQRCTGYSRISQPAQCSYVKVDSTHFYIGCDFNGTREYVKTN